MTITKVNSSAGVGANASSQATTIGFTPTAGNLLVMYIGTSEGGGARTISDPAGWTRLGFLNQMNGASLGGAAAMFVKISAGNENSSPPTIVSSGNQAVAWLFEEWPATPGGAVDKIDSNLIPVTPTIPATFNGYTVATTSTTINSNTLTMPNGDCLVLTVYGGRGSTAQPAPTWGGGAVASSSGATGQAAFVHSAKQEVTSSGSNVTHTATITNTQGGPAEVIGSVAFSVGVTAGGGGSGTSRKVRVGGVATAVTGRKVRVAGVSTTATRKVRVGGVAV